MENLSFIATARPSVTLLTFDKLGELCKVWQACDKSSHSNSLRVVDCSVHINSNIINQIKEK